MGTSFVMCKYCAGITAFIALTEAIRAVQLYKENASRS